MASWVLLVSGWSRFFRRHLPCTSHFPKQQGPDPSLPARRIPREPRIQDAGRAVGTALHSTGTSRKMGSGAIGSSQRSARLPLRRSPPEPWPPASQPFPGNLIAAADELKMHFLPPCCKIFINVRREGSAPSARGRDGQRPGGLGGAAGAGGCGDGSGAPVMLRERGQTGKLRHGQGKCLVWK